MHVPTESDQNLSMTMQVNVLFKGSVRRDSFILGLSRTYIYLLVVVFRVKSDVNRKFVKIFGFS